MKKGHCGVARYRLSLAGSGLSSRGRRFVVAQYREARQQLEEFDRRYRFLLHRHAACRLYPRQRLANFGRHVYGLARRLSGDALLEQVAQDAAAQVSDIVGPGLLARAARLALVVINRTAGAEDEQWIRTRIQSLLLKRQSGGNMNEEQAVPTADDKLAAARAREEKVVVKVKLSELRERVQEYLTERLESKEAAELAAQGLVEAFEARSRAARPKPLVSGNGADNGRRAHVDWASDDSVVTRFRSRRTVEGLKLALAGHQPVVRLVVAERLLGQRSIDEIAAKFDLTREEVLDILAKMRFWVGRFTDSYRDDWYWTDSAQKYSIPEHRLAPKSRRPRMRN